MKNIIFLPFLLFSATLFLPVHAYDGVGEPTPEENKSCALLFSHAEKISRKCTVESTDRILSPSFHLCTTYCKGIKRECDFCQGSCLTPAALAAKGSECKAAHWVEVLYNCKKTAEIVSRSRRKCLSVIGSWGGNLGKILKDLEASNIADANLVEEFLNLSK